MSWDIHKNGQSNVPGNIRGDLEIESKEEINTSTRLQPQTYSQNDSRLVSKRSKEA